MAISTTCALTGQDSHLQTVFGCGYSCILWASGYNHNALPVS